MNHEAMGSLEPREAQLEGEVTRLRIECSRLLHEFETRVERVITLPARARATVNAIEQATWGWLRHNSRVLLAFGIVAIGGVSGAILARWLHQRRGQRSLGRRARALLHA